MGRRGDSCCIDRRMITKQSRAVESRSFFDWHTDWREIAEQCIREKRFSITTVCLNYHENPQWYPSEQRWKDRIEETVVYLLSKGANKYNARIDIINEPTKHIRTNDVPDPDRYLQLEHWAHDQIKGRLIMGAGCDELIYSSWQDRVASKMKGEVYVIHIQASCDTKEKTTYFVNTAKNRAIKYNKLIDCNEGNYADVSTSNGFELMKFQAEESERIGCPNYLNVFNDLWREAFKSGTTQWDKLCFKIDGNFRNKTTEKYYKEWTGLMDSKAPVPNIPIPEEEAMKLEQFYYWRKVAYNRDPDKYGVKFIQEAMNNHMTQKLDAEDFFLQDAFEAYNEKYTYTHSPEYDPDRTAITLEEGEQFLKVDGDYGEKTAAVVEEYQRFKNIDDDGIVGPITFDNIMDENYKTFTKVQLDWARNS
jgi:peptidoglycan hydrolase-like protein with peptidoglycan-binding domain